jgi:hypothetical protein
MQENQSKLLQEIKNVEAGSQNLHWQNAYRCCVMQELP